MRLVSTIEYIEGVLVFMAVRVKEDELMPIIFACVHGAANADRK